MIIEEISWSSTEVWRRLRHLRNGVFLDSSRPSRDQGHWSLFMADPVHLLRGERDRLHWRSMDGIFQFEGHPWDAIDHFLSRFVVRDASRNLELPGAVDGGLVAGYLGYELSHSLEKLPEPRPKVLPHPDFWLAFYDVVFVFDHVGNKSWLVSSGRIGQTPVSRARAEYRRDQFLDELESDVINFPKGREQPLRWRPLVSKREYEDRYFRISSYIRQGDAYEVNLTYPFEAPLTSSPSGLYEDLRRVNPAPFSAFIDGGDFQVLSSSPEEFLKIRGREVRTRPVKGTCARLGNAVEDWERARVMLGSAKNRAELLMITDLLRNDLGRIARYGTVCVPELVTCEEYSTVYHLVSTITAHIREEIEPWEVVMACFPGGSITGAPKLRAQQIIHECEPYCRGVYTGAVGYFASGVSHWNVAIRTMICGDGRASFSVGGAITSDSDVEGEFLESLDKARALLKAGGVAAMSMSSISV